MSAYHLNKLKFITKPRLGNDDSNQSQEAQEVRLDEKSEK